MVLRLVLLFLTPVAALAAPDCDAVLARCRETPQRCSAAKLKRCLRQGVATCAMVVPASPAEHCTRCPTARCQADGTTCENCEVPAATVPEQDCGALGAGSRHPCCDKPPQPINCEQLDGGPIPRTEVCRLLPLPPGHPCCVEP